MFKDSSTDNKNIWKSQQQQKSWGAGGEGAEEGEGEGEGAGSSSSSYQSPRRNAGNGTTQMKIP